MYEGSLGSLGSFTSLVCGVNALRRRSVAASAPLLLALRNQHGIVAEHAEEVVDGLVQKYVATATIVDDVELIGGNAVGATQILKLRINGIEPCDPLLRSDTLVAARVCDIEDASDDKDKLRRKQQDT